MYLKKILIENVGPIEKIDIELPFHSEGEKSDQPKPLILVGANGSGKTILISHIVDAIFEFQKQHFTDVTKPGGQLSSYFKFGGGSNQKVGSSFGLSYLKFSCVENGVKKELEYLDKSGELSFEEAKEKTGSELSLDTRFEEKKNYKGTTAKSGEGSELDFKQNTYCFFPANRSEIPHWLNTESTDGYETFQFKQKLNGRLEKPLVISSSLKENKAWLMDVVLDQHAYPDEVLSKLRWAEVNKLIQDIFGQKEIALGIAPRGQLYRLGIWNKDQNGKLKTIKLEQLNNLSAGQTVLLNLFVTILRYSDSASLLLEGIEGIVVIDEIDLHLHTNLQAEVLPKLISLFPKIQFIVTTHSPVFLLGMENLKNEKGEKVFGDGNFVIREIIDGKEREVEAEGFVEYKEIFEKIKSSKKFEEEVEKQLLEKIQKGTKPLIFVEGPTDVSYIEKAAERLKFSRFGEVDLESISNEKGNKNGGNGSLETAFKFLKMKPDLLGKKVLIIRDPEDSINEKDKGIEAETNGKLLMRVLSSSEESPLKKNNKNGIGIEGLFPKSLIDKLDKKWLEEHTKTVGGVSEVRGFYIHDDCKKEVCEWICENAADNDFTNFRQIFDMIEEILKPDSESKSLA
ncbi:MAG: AAA family ATPase [Proteobacteria bacterium]|nr:AAA family ATPase [Pseudomonadota bacterium]